MALAECSIAKVGFEKTSCHWDLKALLMLNPYFYNQHFMGTHAPAIKDKSPWSNLLLLAHLSCLHSPKGMKTLNGDVVQLLPFMNCCNRVTKLKILARSKLAKLSMPSIE